MPTPVPTVVAPTGDYAAEWQIIDSLEQQGLYKTALERTEALRTRIKADKNGAQSIKALMYAGKYAALLEEDGLVKAAKQFESEVATAAQPEKALLQSLLGELYATYLRNQGWQLRNRTPRPDEGGDLLTWSAEQVERRSLGLYAASVGFGMTATGPAEQEATANLLRNTPVDYLRDLSAPGAGDTVVTSLRPTLYDFLAHRALDYFGNERNYLNEPTYKYYLEQPAAFAPSTEFVRADFPGKDTTSGKWMAIRLFQRVVQFHATQNNEAALIDAELQRLAFAHNNSTLPDKNERYLTALLTLNKQHYAHPSDAEIVAGLMRLYQVMDSEADKPTNQYLRTAVSEGEDAIRRHPNTYGAQICQDQLNVIRRASLSATTEQVNLPDQPALARIAYKNVSNIWVKVVAVPSDPDYGDRWNDKETLQNLNALPALQPRSWKLTDPGDFREHSTEIKIDALPIGHYRLLAADNAEFDGGKGWVSVSPLIHSNLTVVHLNEAGPTRMVVVDRRTGAPLEGVKGEFFRSEWDNSSNRNSRISVAKATSDAQGLMAPTLDDNNWYSGCFTLKNDVLWDQGFGNRYRYNPVPQRTVQFFTDRGLYRPGQTIYFKGILLDRDERQTPKIAPNTAVTVKLLDVNSQEKGELKLRSNEFGTFNGAFTAPSGGLTGAMSIQVDNVNGQAQFSVEEYKRPKFEVTFPPMTGAYRLNDEVAVKGLAKNYAGSNVDGAAVRYRVTRSVRYPFMDWGRGAWGGFPYYFVDAQEIAFGETTTDANGEFSVKFTAAADKNIPEKDQPLFDFQISADITDISGETRSGSTGISVSKKALVATVELDELVDVDSLVKVGITARNLAGQPVPAKGTIRLIGLMAPPQPYINRYWETVDQPVLDAAAFAKDFPDYAFGEAANPLKWAQREDLNEFSFDTEKAPTVNLSNGRIRPGTYLLRMDTKDAFGDPITAERVIRVWSSRQPASRFTLPEASIEKNTVQPGETAVVAIGCAPSAQPLNVFFAPERDGNLTPSWRALKDADAFKLPVAESDRGGLFAIWFAVRNNRFYGESIDFAVPYSNKELSVKYETFRDKLLPGQPEEWKLTISGAKKEKVAAEMVAAMYDASLDQFYPFNWNFYGFSNRSRETSMQSPFFNAANGQSLNWNTPNYRDRPERRYRAMNWFGFPLYGGRRPVPMMAMQRSAAPGGTDREEVMDMAAPPVSVSKMAEEAEPEGYSTKVISANVAADQIEVKGGKPTPQPAPAPRRNLNETVFFFPELRTDAQGNVVVKFTMNEALTRWKFMAFAHTKDLQSALTEKTVVTQKELMVIANAPRFFRAGDAMTFAAKVSNLSQQALSGKATLNLLDAETMQPIDAQLGLTAKDQPFTAAAGQSAPLQWSLKIPADYTGAVTWQIFAESGAFRDGEESALPVVTNRMLVTETLPITLRANQSKTFTFESLRAVGSGQRVAHRYTVEFTANPVWYAVQSLPYLMEYPHECSEQIFSRFYANTLASSVTRKMPNIRKAYERTMASGNKELTALPLQKNQELKYALLEETPWVLEAQSEERQRQNIALLFDLNRMADEQERALNTLKERQVSDGGWPWFPGGRPDWYITQHIAEGLGHLLRLGAIDASPETAQRTGGDNTQESRRAQMAVVMQTRALAFCKTKADEHYREIERYVQEPGNKTTMDNDHLIGLVIHYLYARSFAEQNGKADKITTFYLDQAQKHWLKKNLYEQGLLALALHRAGRTEPAQAIVRSLRERALQKEELGMYWPNDWGMYWYQLPIETQALMVEVFAEVANDPKAVDELRIWLLKNKQTNRWESTKSTAQAVYALLLGTGTEPNKGIVDMAAIKPVKAALGGKTIQPGETAPGTGYYKQAWAGKDVKSSWAEIKVENPNPHLVWGAAYWQYFDDLDKITSFKKTGLTVVKQLYRQENSDTGPRLVALQSGDGLKVGDKVTVRLEIRVDRAMEYVHLKDTRAAGFEPVNVLSGYKWQGGLGYYESTKDLATHFFMDHLPRGTHVFEYPLVVSHKGDFSCGVATLQCMYAPEFTTHSEGVRVKVQ